MEGEDPLVPCITPRHIRKSLCSRAIRSHVAMYDMAYIGALLRVIGSISSSDAHTLMSSMRRTNGILKAERRSRSPSVSRKCAGCEVTFRRGGG